MKRFRRFIPYLSLVIVFIGLLWVLSVNDLVNTGSKGIKAVKYMYNFNDLDNLVDNTEKLKSIVTEDVYNYVSYENVDKSLQTYLKFKNEKVEVTVLDVQPGVVIYTLNSGYISSGRKFMFMYKMNAFGKISYVREMEVIDFYANSTGISN